MSATREEVAKGLAEELGWQVSDDSWYCSVLLNDWTGQTGNLWLDHRIRDALISREMELIELRETIKQYLSDLEAIHCPDGPQCHRDDADYLRTRLALRDAGEGTGKP